VAHLPCPSRASRATGHGSPEVRPLFMERPLAVPKRLRVAAVLAGTLIPGRPSALPCDPGKATMPGTTAQKQPDTSDPSRFLGPDRNWHLGAGLMTVAAAVAFTIWAFSHTGTDTNVFLLILAIAFGLFMAFNIGGNDVANAFGTSVGAGTLTMKQALVVAAVFAVSGALLAGGDVTDTGKSGIVDLSAVARDPMDFAFIMIAALVGASVWLLVATRMGWPVSTTHAIIGGIIGASLTIGFVTGTGGFSMVQWSEVGQIAISWVLSPALGGLAAFLIYGLIKKHV